ncbi:phage distal tail protein [Kitasatospora sp. NPDC094011]|uniref:phage distal tail protein n=1 Tax=Kitasatospora sp. NPDC094011 TaxID=3364090 RepID=UPI0037F4F30D
MALPSYRVEPWTMDLGGLLLGGSGSIVLHEPTGILASTETRTARSTRIGRPGVVLGDDVPGARIIHLSMTVLDSPETLAALLAVLRRGADRVLRFAIPGVAGGAGRVAVRVGEWAAPLDVAYTVGAARVEVELTAADPHLYSDQEFTARVVPAVPRGAARIWPVRFPFSFAKAGVTGAVADPEVTVDGSAETWPVITLRGPLSAPVITNRAVPGERLRILLDVPAGEVLTVDTGARTVQLNGADRYALSSDSVWFPLRPGANRWELDDLMGGRERVADLRWRSAWI